MGYTLGIDEVGRGAWAGPLVIGAVILNNPINGLRDSKLLSARQREEIAGEILKNAEFVGLGWAEPEEIDSYGLSASHDLACRRAVRNSPECSQIIIDGNINYMVGYDNVACIVKADQTVPEVSAASIVAKVARDTYMADLHKDFPLFNFLNNVGYGTKIHREALASHGPTIHHRRSFSPVSVLV
ncbi:MAG TPA: ribonuclease HII [Candidatus Saccharimonadales bacterium]|nr:ribonuclease HII [Candidatus Saccharimonadales bacterium]